MASVGRGCSSVGDRGRAAQDCIRHLIVMQLEAQGWFSCDLVLTHRLLWIAGAEKQAG